MIVVVGGIKGGTGKTTIATNLAVCNARTRRTLLVDADEQRSCSDWSDLREKCGMSCIDFATISLVGKSVHSQLSKMHSDYDDIIIDAGGRDTTSQRSALIIADTFLVPFKPRSFDIWTLCKVKELLSEIQTVNIKLKSYFVINQGDPKGSDNNEAREILNEDSFMMEVPVVISNRKAFSNAASLGNGVVELSKTHKQAQDEMERLYTFLFSQK